MIKKLNVAVIGIGVGITHAEYYLKNKLCNLKIVCDFNKKKISHFKKKYKNIKTTYNEDDIFKDKTIDLVSLASFDSYHFSQILKCFKYKKHFFVEKPICKNKNELKKIRKLYLLNKNKVKFSSNFVLRGNKNLIEIKKRISKNKKDPIFYIDGDYNYGRLNKIVSGWRSKEKNYSINLGGSIHIIDLFNWFTKTKILQVNASANKIATYNTKFKYNDFSSATIKFKNNIIGKINANFGGVLPHNHKITVYTKKKTYMYSSNQLFIYSSREKEKDPKKYLKNSYDRSYIINSFISHIMNKKKLEVTPENIFESMSIAFAIDESIKLKKWIKVNYI